MTADQAGAPESVDATHQTSDVDLWSLIWNRAADLIEQTADEPTDPDG